MKKPLLSFRKRTAYLQGAGRFFRHPLSSEDCRQRIEQQLAAREASFLRILERGILAQQGSPYRRLLRHAGLDAGDVASIVRRDGLEAALSDLHDAGVYVTLDEFKGRRPISRPGLELVASASDFDNPLLSPAYEAKTGGSRGPGTRVLIDLDLLSHDAAYHELFLSAFDVGGLPMAIWLPALPGVIATKLMLCRAKLRRPVERWFTQSPLRLVPGSCESFLFTRATLSASRWWGTWLPTPEHVPLSDAVRVAEWLAEKKTRGTPALLATNPSSAVRVCRSALERRLDIAGSFFHMAGEPFTAAKARVLAASGVHTATFYGMAEVGFVGMACAAPSTHLDEVHLLSDKIAAIQRDRAVGESDLRVGALFYTTLLPSCPKLMLNVDVGDYGIVARDRCGCPFDQLGFQCRLHGIRSYDKLTSEGMTFAGSAFLMLVDEVLPAHFGGSPTDYQFVEEEDRGLPKVGLIVSPRVGHVDEKRLAAVLLQALSADSNAAHMMADRWRQGETLRIIRREPYTTHAAKVLPLHVLRSS
jgi:hypothetical protein